MHGRLWGLMNLWRLNHSNFVLTFFPLYHISDSFGSFLLMFELFEEFFFFFRRVNESLSFLQILASLPHLRHGTWPLLRVREQSVSAPVKAR